MPVQNVQPATPEIQQAAQKLLPIVQAHLQQHFAAAGTTPGAAAAPAGANAGANAGGMDVQSILNLIVTVLNALQADGLFGAKP